MGTKKGIVKKTHLMQYSAIKKEWINSYKS